MQTSNIPQFIRLPRITASLPKIEARKEQVFNYYVRKANVVPSANPIDWDGNPYRLGIGEVLSGAEKDAAQLGLTYGTFKQDLDRLAADGKLQKTRIRSAAGQDRGTLISIPGFERYLCPESDHPNDHPNQPQIRENDHPSDLFPLLGSLSLSNLEENATPNSPPEKPKPEKAVVGGKTQTYGPKLTPEAIELVETFNETKSEAFPPIEAFALTAWAITQANEAIKKEPSLEKWKAVITKIGVSAWHLGQVRNKKTGTFFNPATAFQDLVRSGQCEKIFSGFYDPEKYSGCGNGSNSSGNSAPCRNRSIMYPPGVEETKRRLEALETYQVPTAEMRAKVKREVQLVREGRFQEIRG